MVQFPDGRRMRHPINQLDIVFGRDASCDVPINDGIASRRHAKFFRDAAGAYWVEDLKSKNGISLNEKPIVKAQVKPGDRIGIGTCLITLVSDSATSVILEDETDDTQFGLTSAWQRDQRWDLSEKRLKTLYELNERLTGRFDRDDLLEEVLNVCTEHLQFERAGIAIWGGGSQPPQWLHLRNLSPDASGEFRISRSVVERALHHAERTLIVDTASGEMDPTASMISNNIRSAMCVPMEYLQEVRGVVYGDRVTSVGSYTRQDIDFFAALGRLGAMGLANVHLVQEIKRGQQVELQLQTAREIQAHLFPPGPLNHEGLFIDALNDPGLKVSGDYYDYFVRPDGRVVVVIADVAGKGVPASLLMANLQAAVHIRLAEETDLAAAVCDVNRLVCKNVSDGRFITAILGLLDLQTRRFTYVNAGHHGPYVIRGDERVEKIEVQPSFPLGFDQDAPYQTAEVDLSDRPSTLLLFTDGVPDAENELGEYFAEDRLAAALEANPSQPPDELVTRIRRSIKQFTRGYAQTDDITLVAARLE